MKRAILFSVIFSLLFCFNIPVFAQDYSSEKPSATDVAWDVLWIRPLGFLGLALGEVAYVISLPVTIPLNKKEEAKEILIDDPYTYYFNRPLGEM